MPANNSTNETLFDDWKTAKETATLALAMQQIAKEVKDRLYYENPEDTALKKTLKAQRTLEELNNILVNSLEHKVDYWKLITPIFIPPQEPEFTPAVLLPKPDLTLPDISHMPSYYTRRPVQPVIDSIPITDPQPIQEVKIETNIQKIFSFVKRNKKVYIYLAIILIIFLLLSR